MAAASDVALASAAILATAMGGIRVPPLPRSRARTFRPLTASAIASRASAGTPVQGSGGSTVYTRRSISHAPAAQSTKPITSVRVRVGVIGAPPSRGPVQHGAVGLGDSVQADRGQQVRDPAPARDPGLRVGGQPGREDEGALVGAGVR